MGARESRPDSRRAAGKTRMAVSVSRRTGRLFVLSGPSGVGKDALLAQMLERTPGLTRSVSATTRAPRAGEREGVDYHFVSRAEFETAVAAGEFLEHEEYGGELYGTPLHAVSARRERGEDVLLKIEVKGAAVVRALVPDAVLIFVAPPSFEELERRLRSRGTDSAQHARDRLETARAEIDRVSMYDYCVVNDDLCTAADAVRCVVIAERCRVTR